MDSPSFNLNHVNFVLVQSPFGGTVRNIPGKIEAEHYDLGGQGIAYNDLTAGNSGNTFRTDDVDVQTTTDTGGGHNIGFVQAGEWLEYIVNVTSSGTYTLEARVSATSVGKTFHVELNGQNISGTITVPNTGNYQTFQTISVTTPSLTAGLKTMRIVMGASSFNVNYLNFAPAGALLRVAAPTTSEGTILSVESYPNPFTEDATIRFNLSEEGQTSLIVHDITGKTLSTLENGYLPAGIHQRTVKGSALPGGVYIIKLVHNKKIVTTLLLKQ